MAIQPVALVVEDDDIDRYWITAICRTNGWRVHAFADGKAALEWMRGHPLRRRYRAALIDLKLPGMSGLELVRIMGQFAPDVPCAIVTGEIGLMNVDLSNLKIVMVVQKPFKESHFKELLKKLKIEAIKSEQ